MKTTQKFTESQATRDNLPRKPIMEKQEPVIIQDSRNHKCKWRKEDNQTHPTLISYICTHRRCGRGLLIDPKTDSIDNY